MCFGMQLVGLSVIGILMETVWTAMRISRVTLHGSYYIIGLLQPCSLIIGKGALMLLLVFLLDPGDIELIDNLV